MIGKDLIPYLRIAHGSFNTIVMLLFLYQARLGLTIRKQRKTSGPPLFKIIKRHRKFGPVFAFVGILGFFAGLTLIYVDYGRAFKYPPHFITGSLIALSLVATFLVSRQIRPGESSWRNTHFMLGILIISLYIIQVFLGFGILF